MPNRALFASLPASRDLPHVSLCDLPTPVEPLAALGDELGLSSLWIKRDDLTGDIYGGNKARKLEFLLADALEQGHEEVWTVGAIGSNHALATCLYAREVGLSPSVLHYPQPITEHVRHNLLAISTAKPSLTLATNFAKVSYELALKKVHQWLAAGDDPYYVPAGGSSAIGVLGYVDAALELADQVRAGQCPEPDVIFVAAGTCGTLAGLLLGVKVAGLSTRVVGVRVVDKVITNTHNTCRLANAAADLLEQHGVHDMPRITRDEIALLDAYFGDGYGEPTPLGARAIDLMEELQDIHLEPTYTGKAFAAVLGERDNLKLHSKNILYWHTLSSADLSARLARANPSRDLPAEYQKFLK